MTPHDWDLLRQFDAGEEAALAAMRERVFRQARRRYPVWPYAAAAAVLLAALLGYGWMPSAAPVELIAYSIAPPAAPEVSLMKTKPILRAAAIPKREPAEPLVIKLVTGDPDVVIYLVSNGAAE